jgi:hypothetical protein
MTKSKTSTRRSFLRGGALLAAPIAAASLPAAALADDELKTRTKRLEAEAAIRELHQSWLRRANTGERDALLEDTVRRITVDHAGASDHIELAADGRSAVGYFDCAVEVEIPLSTEGTLAQMAHAQGHGTVRRTERRALRVDYTNIGGTWKIASVVLRTL